MLCGFYECIFLLFLLSCSCITYTYCCVILPDTVVMSPLRWKLVQHNRTSSETVLCIKNLVYSNGFCVFFLNSNITYSMNSVWLKSPKIIISWTEVDHTPYERFLWPNIKEDGIAVISSSDPWRSRTEFTIIYATPSTVEYDTWWMHTSLPSVACHRLCF